MYKIYMYMGGQPLFVLYQFYTLNEAGFGG